MEDCPSRNLCASRIRLPPVSAVAGGQKGVLRAWGLATMAPIASRQPQSHQWAARLAATRLAIVRLTVRAPLALAAARSACAPVGDGDTSAPTLDASAATTTSVTRALHSAQPPQPTATTAVVSHNNSGGQEPAVGFEARQRTRLGWFDQPRFWPLVGTHLCSYHCQKCLRHHRQRNVAIPAYPASHLIVIQTDFAFAGLNAFFNRPTCARNLDLFSQARSNPCKGNICRHIACIRQRASHNQPTPKTCLCWLVQLQTLPVIPAYAFGARSSTDALPALVGQGGQQ